MHYDPDMTVFFDVVTKKVFVSFRGRNTMLGPFSNQRIGIEAGEAYCRELGWVDTAGSAGDIRGTKAP